MPTRAVLVCALALITAASNATAASQPSYVIARGVTPGGSPWKLTGSGRTDNACVSMAARFPSQGTTGVWNRQHVCGLDVRRGAPFGANLLVSCPGHEALVFGVVPASVGSVVIKPRHARGIEAALYAAPAALGNFSFYVGRVTTARRVELLRALDRRGRTIDTDRLGEGGGLCSSALPVAV